MDLWQFLKGVCAHVMCGERKGKCSLAPVEVRGQCCRATFLLISLCGFLAIYFYLFIFKSLNVKRSLFRKQGRQVIKEPKNTH